jgi:pimeloyl-ACP methyl ester carboxylesterase
VSLDPGGFWTDLQAKVFGASSRASGRTGAEDRVTLPSQAATALERFRGARLHWFEKCGHFPHWEQPEQAAALILDSTR